MKLYACSLIVLLLHASWALGAHRPRSGPGEDAELYYDPTTGNVEIDATHTASGEILSFVFATDQNNLRPENFIAPFIDVGTNTDRTTFQIGQTDPLNQGAGPVVDIGKHLSVGNGML